MRTSRYCCDRWFGFERKEEMKLKWWQLCWKIILPCWKTYFWNLDLGKNRDSEKEKQTYSVFIFRTGAVKLFVFLSGLMTLEVFRRSSAIKIFSSWTSISLRKTKAVEGNLNLFLASEIVKLSIAIFSLSVILINPFFIRSSNFAVSVEGVL